jgi:hypothetical protein
MMSTNSHIINLIGMEGSDQRGENLHENLWCTVFYELPKANTFTEFGAVSEAFLKIAAHIPEFLEFACLFLSFLEAQIRTSRPGLSDILIKSLGRMKSISTPSSFFNHFCSNVFDMLHNRKPALTTDLGFKGSVLMMQAAGIECSSDATVHVENHFFNLAFPKVMHLKAAMKEIHLLVNISMLLSRVDL